MTSCDECGRDDGISLKVCANCREASYCSKECQREAWKTHHRAVCEGYCCEECRVADCCEMSTAPLHYAHGSGPSSVDVNSLADTIKAMPMIKNATRGVPIDWYNAVTFPIGNNISEYLDQLRRFVLISKKATIEAVDAIVGLCRNTCVLHAFKTHGSVCKMTRWLRDETKIWTIKPKFKAALQEVIDPFDGCDIVEAELLVLGIMRKRSKSPDHPLTVSHGLRQFIVIHGTDSGSWFDVTQSNDPASQDMLTSLPTPVRPRICQVCGEFGKNVCARCNKARYCSQACQSSDWRNGHKEACKADSPLETLIAKIKAVKEGL